MTAATSILQLLTEPNPTVFHQKPRSNTNTRGLNWYQPKQLKVWDEFDDFSVLEASFGRHLLREARRGDRRLPPYPTIHPDVDCVIGDERETEALIGKWNKTIVTAALDPIQHDFHPLIWRQGDPPPKGKGSNPPPQPEKERTQPPRKSSHRARKPKLQSLRRLKSDSGSTSWYSRHPRTGSTATRYRQEKFPKEYKPATKWRSEWVIEGGLIDETGQWKKGQLNHNYAMPIRQAYTYCIQHMCRYGCILTCREAFIFRVKPRDSEPVIDAQNPKLLQNRLINNGLMEYISIPWANHHRGDLESRKTWTVNLALWFVHVLAGNNYEAGWTYERLKDESLAASISAESHDNPALLETNEDEHGSPEKEDDIEESESSDSSDSDDSDRTVPFDISPLTKRKRSSDVEDGYHHSFAKRQVLEV